MPSKNRIKIYLENGYYHIYNRGVNKLEIFHDEQDYAVFLSYLKEYLMPKDEKYLREKLADPRTNYKEKDKILKILRLNNFANEIILLAYSLMPNHFHFLIKQISAMAIDKFMNSLGTRYTMFFNKKSNRTGTLYQDVFKAVSIESEEQLLYTTAYIHRNSRPKNLASQGLALRGWFFKQPSSLPEYLGLRKTEWVHPEEILSYFSKTNPQLSYQSFVEQTEDISLIEKLIIDD